MMQCSAARHELAEGGHKRSLFPGWTAYFPHGWWMDGRIFRQPFYISHVQRLRDNLAACKTWTCATDLRLLVDVAKRALQLFAETCNSQNMLGLIPALSAHERFFMKPLFSNVVLISSSIDFISLILLESEKVSFSLRLNPQHTQPQSLELVLKIISRELFCKCKAQ